MKKNILRKGVLFALAASLFVPAAASASSAAQYPPGGGQATDSGPTELLMEASDVNALPEGGTVESSYGSMHLVSFASEAEAADAQEAYGDAASFNVGLSVANEAAGQGGDGAVAPEVFDNLKEELDGVPKAKGKKKGYTVALIDTGVPKGSGIEAVSMLGDDGFDRHGHGAAMLKAMRSMDGDVDVISIKALNDRGYGDVASVYAAIQYAIGRKVSVISLSMYGPASEGNAAIESAISEAVDAGIHVVAAAGNDGRDVEGYVPAGLPGVLAIGACGKDGNRLETSNFGTHIHCYAVSQSTSEAAAKMSGALSKAGGSTEKVMEDFAGTFFIPKVEENVSDRNDGEGSGKPDEGFQAAYTDAGNITNANNDALMPDLGLRIYNQASSVEMTWKNFKFGTVSGTHLMPDGSLAIVSSRADGKARAGDGFTARYINAGRYNGEGLDVQVKFTFRDCTHFGVQTAITGIGQITANKGRGNLLGGWTYRQAGNVKVEYCFYATGEDRVLPIERVYVSWGSLNYAEGFMPYDYTGLKIRKLPGAYPAFYNINANETGSGTLAGRPYAWTCRESGKWVVNFTSDDFTDEWQSDTFWKSIAMVEIEDTDNRFNFYTLSDDFWFAPTFSALGATAEKPKKRIIKDGEEKTSVTEHSGNTVTFEITQPVGRLGYYGEMQMKYSNFSFKDVLPDGLTYKSARVVKRTSSGDTTVTGKGTLTHSGQTVKFKFNSDYLSSGMAYTGESYVLIIKAEVDDNGETCTMENQASTTICNTEQKTNKVTVKQYYYNVKTQIRYRDVNGDWGNYKTIDTETVERGDDYSFVWVRDDDKEPENIYYDADPDEIDATNIKEDKTFKIDVERKKYTYSFDFNPPTGHTVDEITNRQADKENKWAETKSGTAKDPALRGYTFLGWNTKKDGSGSDWKDEKMLSNKKFYARWEPIKYYVDYDANGETNFSHESGEYTQNKTAGTMARSTFRYDEEGNLRANAFTREGYTFNGWNTERDGSGTSYTDQADVLNWTDEDEKVFTLYAQWVKKLGTETLTVISEETGNPIAGVTVKLYQKGTDTGIQKTTDAQGQVSVSGLHWFGYEWRSVSVPAGYRGMANAGFAIYPNCSTDGTLCSHTSGTRPTDGHASLSVANTRILYMKHVSLVLDSRVSEVIRGENPPAFVYHVSGVDAAGVRHEYDVMVQVGSNLNGTNRVPDMFAGTYTVTQTPVSRYKPGNAQAVRNASVSGINGTANLLDVADLDHAEILFPYTIQQMGGFGSMHSQTNQLAK